MSKIEVNTVEPQCGTTLTLGASGDTVTLGSGASQSGFGRQGSVDWQTSIKTTSFTAVSGEGYFINTTSGAVTMTLPASPSVGDIVAFKDYAGTFQTNNLTINRNGSNVIGGTTNPIISVEGQAGTLVYGDATQGWQIVEAATDADLPRPGFVAATGGTITTVCTNFKVHTFTGPGTFTVTCAGNAAGSNTVDYLVIAGGGSGGAGKDYSTGITAGGGAGGYRESSGTASGCYSRSPLGACVSALPVSAQGYPITVGAGGAAAGGSAPQVTMVGTKGSNSIFSSITSAGGGGGAGGTIPGGNPGVPNDFPATNPDIAAAIDGGSGGGGSYYNGPAANDNGGRGNTPPVSPSQGNKGGQSAPGSGSPAGTYAAGGGGGAGAEGASGLTGASGAGGAGATSSINGTPTTRAGGGGSGGSPAPVTSSAGGAGGGGAGGCGASSCAVAGTVNTGSGGGGHRPSAGGCSTNGNPSGAGGSGIVIIRYKFQ